MTCILLIGGTGQIGPWAVAGLRERAPEARVWTMNRRGRAPDGATPLQGDRHDPGALRAALRAARPEVVIDMIAFTGDEAEATAAILREEGVARAVVVSSADVYEVFSRINRLVGGPPEPGPVTEEARLRSGAGSVGAAYDKPAVERAYATALPHVAALRLPAVYGWPDRSRIEGYAGPMLEGVEEIALHPRLARWRFARVLCRNAGWAVALAALGGWSGFRAWNVAEPVSPSEAEWAARIGRAAGWRGRIVESEAEDPPDFGVEQDFVLSDARIRTELGYAERHDPEEGLRDAVRRDAEARRAG